MNDLDLVALVNGGFRPLGTADDAVVDLDCDPLSGQRKKLQQTIEVDVRGNLPGLTV
jgi:hypothetical protein